MSRVVIVGGSIAGLANALALAGHREVVVLERGAAPPDGPAGEAGQRWARPTVPSFPHAHTLTSLGVLALLDRAPKVVAAALDAGAAVIDLNRAKPPEPSATLPDDADLLAVACRRPTLELVLYRIVRELPGVRIRHGATVRGLVLNARRDRVTGVVLDGGERIDAEIVLDATGRRAEARPWLAAHGTVVPPDLTSPSGMRIFTRFYRRLGQTATLNRGNAAGVLGEHYASILHPGDGGTFSIALGVLPEDRIMRSLRYVDAFTAVATTTPGIADWLAPGMSTPISPVRAITCPPNMVRTLATSPAPVAGLIPVGDAACVTNPIYGRGISLALVQAFRLADLITLHGLAGPVLNRAAAGLAAELFTPWFHQATADDAERLGLWRAAAAGAPPPPPRRQLTLRMVARVANRDAVVWRGLVRVLMGLQRPAALLGDAGIEHRVRELSHAEAGQQPGPSRADLLEAVARAEAA
jgi:2-polyprenyl-6-methoxyphenol hydroxylase-like FAD-dependent oxidoreductase